MKKALSIVLAALFLSLTACSVSSESSDPETSSEANSTEYSNTESAPDTKSSANTESAANTESSTNMESATNTKSAVNTESVPNSESSTNTESPNTSDTASDTEMPNIAPGETLPVKSKYIDKNGDMRLFRQSLRYRQTRMNRPLIRAWSLSARTEANLYGYRQRKLLLRCVISGATFTEEPLPGIMTKPILSFIGIW